MPYKGYKQTDEHRAKLSAVHMGKTHTEESKAKIGAAKMGNKNPMYGKTYIHSEETRAKISTSHIGKTASEETKAKLRVIQKEIQNRPDVIAKNKVANSGKNHPNWQGGISFKPYCPTFNDSLKETIRNRDNRVCQLCGKSEILNHGYRLCVHHIDGDKMQGCDNKKWHLASLCTSCNSKTDTIKKEFLLVSNMPHRRIATENLAEAIQELMLVTDNDKEEGGDKN